MPTRPLSDKRLTCAACGDGFVFTAGEQELYELRGVAQQPQRCPACTRNSHGVAPAASRR